MENIILHIPHSSVNIPFFNGYLINNKLLDNELRLLTDWYTDELFDLPFSKVTAPFSRIFCDTERFDDDSLEIMSQSGMGMYYTHMDNGGLMREVSPDLRARIKSGFYDPHHQALETLTTESLRKQGHATVIDCHSFPDVPLNHDLNKEVPRPDFCIGTDGYHTPEKLSQNAFDFLKGHGYTVSINVPYSGTMIPLKYYKRNRKVRGLMIEVNRKLYMNVSNDTVSKIENFNNIKSVIKDFFSEVLI